MRYFLCVMCVIAIVDMFSYKVPNWCIILGICIGFVEKIMHGTLSGFIEAVLQMGFLFLVFWPFYILRGIGAGDVKLFMMMSLFFNRHQMLFVLLQTFVLAAVIAIIKMICYRQGRQRLAYLSGYVRKICLTGCMDSYEFPTEKEKTTIRLSLPALISVCIQVITNGCFF